MVIPVAILSRHETSTDHALRARRHLPDRRIIGCRHVGAVFYEGTWLLDRAGRYSPRRQRRRPGLLGSLVGSDGDLRQLRQAADAAVVIGFTMSVVGYLFLDVMPVFLTVFTIFGLTEAMFALSLRKIGFDQSAPERQGRVQGQMASALGIGFTLGPLLGGFVGKWLGPDGLFLLYAVPEVLALILVLLG